MREERAEQIARQPNDTGDGIRTVTAYRWTSCASNRIFTANHEPGGYTDYESGRMPPRNEDTEPVDEEPEGEKKTDAVIRDRQILSRQWRDNERVRRRDGGLGRVRKGSPADAPLIVANTRASSRLSTQRGYSKWPARLAP